ncbi:MAG: DUF1304 domain-containing protein [Flavobacteriaceae bacterium]|nr:DUF1304 domain-containing protein [Flavobacteriaceae bacterium]
MGIVISIIIGLVAFIHCYILWLEMFAWNTRAKKVFRGFPKELFKPTTQMAANQGLYNGFLAAGLIWTFFIENSEWRDNISLFFLSCVAIAGAYGSYSISNKRIFFIQAVPAIIGFVLIVTKCFVK